MFDFHPEQYGPACEPLLRAERLAPLDPGSPQESWRASLTALTPQSLFPVQTIRDPQMAMCCLSGLWLFHDFLDESHTLSQDIDTTSGSYWHGIMHRREPDFWNSKNWFRRVGRHAVFEPLQLQSRQLAEATSPGRAGRFLLTQSEWDPLQFVDWCEAVSKANASRGGPEETLCRQVAQLEWWLLFDHCFRSAIESDFRRVVTSKDPRIL